MIFTDKYYYFPTTTKNIMFVRGEKYMCLSYAGGMKKGETYIAHDFMNENIFENIIFRDSSGCFYNITPFDCGKFISLKKSRKIKLEQINEKAEDNKIKNT